MKCKEFCSLSPSLSRMQARLAQVNKKDKRYKRTFRKELNQLRSRSQVIMTSFKVKIPLHKLIFHPCKVLVSIFALQVLSFLLVVGLSQSAPQISRQGVVSQVIGQLQPAIQRIVASTLGGGRQTAGFGQTGAVPATNFGQFSQGSSFGQGSTLSSGVSASQLTSNVVTSLQPAIAAAVAQALRSSQSRPALSGTSVSALTPEEEARINAQQVQFIT